MAYLLVALGGALGSMARYGMSAAIGARIVSPLPWGTIVVNIVGSLLIGAALALTDPASRWPLSNAARESFNQFFMVGVLGGYTTFSAFSLQTFALLRERAWWAAGANVSVSLIACLVAVISGYALVALIAHGPRG